MLLVNERGVIQNSVAEEYPLCFPKPGWAEQQALFGVFKFPGVRDIGYDRPRSLPYPTENPWDQCKGRLSRHFTGGADGARQILHKA